MLLILVFLLSLVISWVIVHLAQTGKHFVSEKDLHGVQKFHKVAVPRVGGISVFAGISLAVFLLDRNLDVLLLWLSSLPVFIVGLYEDFSTKASPLIRLVFTFLSIAIAFVSLGIGIDGLGFSLVDSLLSFWVISLLFTLLVVGGAVHSLNIIDGFNGLLGGYSILAFLAFSYIAHSLGDDFIALLCLVCLISILGFFLLNFPFGKIFIGDGGAYLVGFMLSIIGLMLVDRHQELSNWLVLLIFIYPMYELLYSIYRRRVGGALATQPDACHLHSLVYIKLISCDRFKHNKVLCNSMTSPIMWILSLFGIIPAVIWYENQFLLIVSVFVFMLVYTLLYKYILSR